MTSLHQLPSSSISSNNPPRVQRSQVSLRATINQTDEAIVRRSANYRPTTWDDGFIQSLTSDFKGEKYMRRLNQLKEEIRALLKEGTKDSLEQLELIDTLQRLGISYHFQTETKDILESIYNNKNNNDDWKKNGLHATALKFRLLRQHGFNISQEIFSSFNDEMKNFNTDHCVDIKGILSLYEASFVSIEGEKVLEAAKCFTKNYLEKYITSSRLDEFDIINVRHAMELPLHWRMPRLEARWFIDIYERKVGMNPILLEIAKLDFNMVQSIHQEDLKYASSWWRSTGLGEKLSFARDRLMVNFLWTVGVRFEPEFGYFRRMTTKIGALLTTIDDVYDVYGTLDELELFTNAVERWDVAAIDQLPDYMKVCFLSLHNSINDMAFDALRDQGVNVIQYFKKMWVDLCKSYLLEAKWYHSGYKPTLHEYLDNACISVTAPVILVHAYVFVTSQIIKEDLERLNEYADIIRWSSTILRLADDLGTSSDELKRGDVLKSIQCYMNDTGVSENSAREYIRHLIDETWKKLNKVEAENSMFSQLFMEISKNIPRMAQCMYQYGDGHAIEHQETMDRVLSLLIQPIPIC